MMQLFKKQEIREIPQIDWLDNLAFRQIEQLQKKSIMKTLDYYLFINFPRINFPIVFCNYKYPTPAALHETSFLINGNLQQCSDCDIYTSQNSLTTKPKPIPAPIKGGLIIIYNPEATQERDNPAEMMKYINLVRS